MFEHKAERRRIDLAQKALEEYRVRCFWSFSKDFKVTRENLGLVIQALRKNGDRRAFQLADRLCR